MAKETTRTTSHACAQDLQPSASSPQPPALSLSPASIGRAAGVDADVGVDVREGRNGKGLQSRRHV